MTTEYKYIQQCNVFCTVRDVLWLYFQDGHYLPKHVGAHFSYCRAVLYIVLCAVGGRDSSLRAGRSGDRIPVGGSRFSAPVQTDPGAHPASSTMGTGSFPGVKRPECGADHPPPPKRRGHERVGLYLYSPSGPSWPVIGRTFTFNLTYYPISDRRTGTFHSSCIYPANKLNTAYIFIYDVTYKPRSWLWLVPPERVANISQTYQYRLSVLLGNSTFPPTCT